MKKGCFHIGITTILTAALLACGGGGGSGSEGSNPTSIPTLVPTPEPTTEPTATPEPTPTTFMVSGSLSVASNSYKDSDNNDPFSEYSDNSDFTAAQPIPNTAVVQGFVTLDATGVVGDRFETGSDEFDFFRVTLQAGQSIRVQVVDYDGFNIESSFEGDIDVELYDQQGTLLQVSNSITEFEELQITSDGEYYIAVYAYSGTSKYVLQLGSSYVGNAVVSNSTDFIPGEAVVTYKSPGNVSQKVANATPKLVKLDTQSGLQKSKKSLSKFEQTLASINPEALEKRQTIAAIKELSLKEEVSAASPNYRRYAFATPNDEFYGLQWHYRAINLPAAWDITTGTSVGTEDVVVAVVDTGIFLSHIELAGQLIPGYDFISDSSSALDGDGIDNNPDDPGDSTLLGQSSWHGTHVAGTIAMLSNNSVGAAGVAPGARIMPLRVLGAQGGSSYDIIQAVSYAAGLSNDSGGVPAQRADIINLSLGGSGFSQAEAQFYQSLHSQGVIVVAAAGNDNSASLMYPASYPGVFSVSATDYAGNRAPYSNFGTQVDLAAPGGDTAADLNGDGYTDGVLSTLVDDSSGTRNSSLQFYQGTSMAAPHVAGVFALMKAVYPDITPAQLDALLQSGEITTDLGNAGRDDNFGWGQIDAFKAVAAARDLAAGGTAPDPDPIVVATPAQVPMGFSSLDSISLSNVGGGSPSVTSINPVETWLNVTAQDVDSQGLGVYSLSANRDGLVNGTYIGTIIFAFDSAPDLVVTVSMQVGDMASDGGVAQLYAILIDPVTNETVQTIFVDDTNGGLSFEFPNVPAGEYQLLVGTDIDNDQFICQTGEACGAYPTLNRIESFTLNQDFINLQFTVDLMSSIESLSNSASQSVSGQQQDIKAQTVVRPNSKYIVIPR